MKTILSKQYLDVQKHAPAVALGAGFKQYFPSYLSQPTCFHCSSARYAWHAFVQRLIQLSIKLMLQPRRNDSGALDPYVVDDVYTREAATYDRKHHLTTRGQDTMWRRYAGWQVTALGTARAQPVAILDLCTGTGLAVFEVANILAAHSVSATITGLDRNQAMLGRAHSYDAQHSGVTTQFVHGDAASLVNTRSSSDDFARFAPGTFDAVTQVFGIGGISEPLPVFEEVLAVLNEGGWFVLVDMHCPIASQPGEWPLFLKWLRTPLLEAVTYQHTTIPLALRRLWAWRDPTLDFYLLPLVTYQDSATGEWWGYETISRVVESERWWLSLPLMPVARMVVRKVRLTQSEAAYRQQLLDYAQSIVVW
ncbi:MAG: class I SAM-dependent methyltransferase [Candidatus Andersenbacteria bacterium]